MSPKSVAFTFGSSTTNRVYSTVDKDGTGVVIRRDSDSNGKAQFWMCSLDAGQPGSWNLINFTFPEGTTNETLDLDQPFYLGYTGDPSNPTIYVYEENDDDDFYSVQYSDLYNYQLIRFSDDSDFELCTSFFAKDNLIAVCDTEYNYYIGESQKTLIPFTNPDELVNRIVGDLSITGGTHASPVGLLQPLPGHSDPVRIRWWFQGNETYFENPRVTPEAIVCFDDYIVWHSNGSDNNTPSVGWIDISKTGNPVTNFNSVVAKGKTVAITKSGTQFQQGDIWYATSDGTVYYVDRSRNDSHQVLDARVDISGGSSTISQLWADSCFLYVLTDNGMGGAWKISDVQ